MGSICARLGTSASSGSPERERSRTSCCANSHRLDVGERAARVPGRKGLDERRRAVELDAPPAGGLGPRELPGVPLDESLDIRRDVEVFLEAGAGLADLRVSELDEEPITLAARAGEVEANDDAAIREPIFPERVAHRPQGDERVEVLGGDLEPTRAPLAERLADREEVLARRRELVPVPSPVGLGCRRDDPEMFELPEALGEQSTGESGRALQDLAECPT